MAVAARKLSKTALGACYRRISYRKSASVAVFATARKPARHIYPGFCMKCYQIRCPCIWKSQSRREPYLSHAGWLPFGVLCRAGCLMKSR